MTKSTNSLFTCTNVFRSTLTHVVAVRIEEEVAESGGTEDVKPHVELASRYTEREPWERGKGGGRDASQHIS